MRRLLIAIACALAAGAASPLAWGDEAPPPPAATSAVEPVTVPSSPEPAPDPAPEPDPAPPAAALKPPKPEQSGSTPAPLVAQPATPPTAQPAPASVKPKPKQAATPKKKPKKKPSTQVGSGRKNGLPEQPPVSKPIQDGSVGAGVVSPAPPPSELERPAASSRVIAADLAPLAEEGGTVRAALSIVLFGLLGTAIVLFGLAAVPPGALGLVSLLVATRRVELAAGGALTVAASATILAAISLSS